MNWNHDLVVKLYQRGGIEIKWLRPHLEGVLSAYDLILLAVCTWKFAGPSVEVKYFVMCQQCQQQQVKYILVDGAHMRERFLFRPKSFSFASVQKSCRLLFFFFLEVRPATGNASLPLASGKQHICSLIVEMKYMMICIRSGEARSQVVTRGAY